MAKKSQTPNPKFVRPANLK